MRAVAQNRIADVVEMRYLNVFQEEGIFKFAGITQNTSATDDNVPANIHARAQDTLIINAGGTFDGSERRQGNVPTDINIACDGKMRRKFAVNTLQRFAFGEKTSQCLRNQREPCVYRLLQGKNVPKRPMHGETLKQLRRSNTVGHKNNE